MIYFQNPANTDGVLDALRMSAGPATVEYRIAVAYVTYDGARTLTTELANRVGAGWAAIPKAIVTCFDFGHTDPTALDLLQAANWTVRIANLTATGEVAIRSQSSYHPKVYLAYEPGGSVRSVVGSANLSRRALTVNTEVVTADSVLASDVESVWSEILARSSPLTPSLRAEYVAKRPLQRHAVQPRERPVPKTPAVADLEAFGEAVAAGRVDPAAFDAFWVEVGGPSGGAGSQLELPRGGNRFFGFTYGTYDSGQHTIGSVTLTAAGTHWTRDLAWHGDNRMERINLPTRNAGGFVYAQQVVLFMRLSTGLFELTVASPTSTRAQRWRDEATANRTLFRFGPNSPRRCGLF